MEKLLYPLWKQAEQSTNTFRDVLLTQLGPELCQLAAVHGARLCVADTAVEPANGRRMQSSESLPEAMLSLWVDDAGAAQQWEPLIDEHIRCKTVYLVVEAEPLINQRAHPTAVGERMYGMCHVVFMSRPPTQSRDQWLATWKDSHTQIAIDTQSTFGYRQNLVVRALGANSPWHDAIVEENFPTEAMTDDHAFYATGGSDAVLERHMQAMMDSCSRFIDFDKIDVIPMSEYPLKLLP